MGGLSPFKPLVRATCLRDIMDTVEGWGSDRPPFGLPD